MTINLISTQHSVHHNQVEWDILCNIISQFAHFECNKKFIVTDLYQGRIGDLVCEFAKTESYCQIIKEDNRQILSQQLHKLPPDNSLPDYIEYIAKDGVLNFKDLNKLAILVEVAQSIKTHFTPLNILEISQLQTMDFQSINRKFLREFRYLVDESGDIHFDRHQELSETSLKLRETEERIRRMIHEWINDTQNQKCLQFHNYDVHYDRYVVPVRSDSYRSDIGLIVSRSESGQTLFVEPYQVREACNKRLELIAKIDEIINRLTHKFSHSLFEFSNDLKNYFSCFSTIDRYLAKSQFANHYQLTCPRIRERPGFSFTNLFHPLLKSPVKNNAECNSSHLGIVISGPNTGGKTVFLKSLALSYLLFYHGLYIPALDAELFPYEGLFYFGNDLQDLSAGLSSFSGEVRNYLELIEQILPSNLILIDEIFNSTSSDEASALSLAYFDELHKRADCHLVVSTHHQMFKTLIHQDRKYVSCHVGFDTNQMKPTYKLQWGTPGSSMAIEIFKILSRGNHLVQDVPKNALSRLSSKNISYETLLQKVSQKQIELDQLLSSNRQLEIELKNQKGSMEGILNLKLQEELSRAKKEVDRILNEARSLVEDAKNNEITKIKKVDEKAHQLKSEIEKLRGEELPQEEVVQIGNLTFEKLKVGDLVYSHVLKKDFTIISLDPKRGEVLIGKGPIKFSVPIISLSKNRTQTQPQVKVSFQKNSNAQFEIDGRGMRLSEFQNIVESSLGDLLSGDIPFLNIIHGHGDGVLKSWLREYLKRSKDFKIEANESGNDGETRVALK